MPAMVLKTLPCSSWVLAGVFAVAAVACGDDGVDEDSGAAESAATSSSSSTGATTQTSGGSSVSTGSSDSTGDSPGSTGVGSSEEGGSDSTGVGACVAASGDPVAQPMTLTTPDGTSIAGIVTRPALGTCLPAVLFVHQFNLDKSQWSAHVDTFVAAGYVTMAIDLRGHGESGPAMGSLTDVLTDPAQAPSDVATALAFLLADAPVDEARVGIVGTSIGANLAVVAASQDLGVSATVAISTRVDPVTSLLDGLPVSLGPFACWAGENDGGGDHAMSCGVFEMASSGPAASTVLPGTGAHGVQIVDDFPETIPSVLAFLDANL